MYIGNPQLSLSRLISCAIKNCHQELGGSGRIYYKLIFQGFPRGIRDCGKIKNWGRKRSPVTRLFFFPFAAEKWQLHCFFRDSVLQKCTTRENRMWCYKMLWTWWWPSGPSSSLHWIERRDSDNLRRFGTGTSPSFSSPHSRHQTDRANQLLSKMGGFTKFKPKYCLTLEICFNRGIKIRIVENMSQYAFMMSAAMLHKAHTRDNRHQPPFLLLPRQHGPPPFEIRFQFVIF